MKFKIIIFILFLICLLIFIKNINNNGKIVTMSLSPIKINALYGYKNDSGKVVIKPKYKRAFPFHNDIALVEICKNDDCYVQRINKKGERIDKNKIYSDLKFLNGLAVVQINNEYGYINESGIFVIKPQFTMATNFEEGLAAVSVYDLDRRCNLWGYIDKKGQNKIPYQFFEATPFSNDIAIVKTILGYNLIDKTGNLLCKQNFLSDLPPLLGKDKKVIKYEVNSDWALGTYTEEIELDCHCNILNRRQYNSNNNY